MRPAQGDRQQNITPTDTPKAVADREDRTKAVDFRSNPGRDYWLTQARSVLDPEAATGAD